MQLPWLPPLVLSLLAASSGTPAGTGSHTFLIDYTPTRADVLTSPTTREKEGILGHMQAMAKLAAEGVITWGGKTGENHALVLVRAEDRADAERIAALDPAVAYGVFTFRVTEFDVKISARFGDAAVEQPGERVVRLEVDLPVGLESAWRAWTDGEAFERATGWSAAIEPRMGGRFEIAFDPSAPKGQAGSEGCRVLALVPRSVLAFEWNAPPSFGQLRFQRTNVVVRLAALDPERTRVTLEHAGFGQGAEWERVADYFARAWPTVLGQMQQRLAPAAR